MLRFLNSKKFVPYLFISPFFVLFLLFWIGPIFISLYYSFTQWDGGSPQIFIGFENYRKLFHDPLFYKALKNTLMLTISYEVIMIPSAVVLAVLLNNFKGFISRFFKVGYFLPVTMASIVVAIVFDLVLGKNYGVLNNILNLFNINSNIDWINNPNTALWSILFIRLWRNTGYYMVFIFAGLQAIPKDLYEAAIVDGASPIGVFFKITIPLLKPMIAFVVFMSLIWQFQIFDEPWVLTGGGPNNATLTVLIYLYQNTFRYWKLGYGSAISYVFTFFIIIITLLQVKFVSGEKLIRRKNK